MQMINRPSLNALKTFLGVPTRHNGRGLYSIPVLYKVLELEFDENEGKYPQELLNVIRWMYNRAKTVLDGVLAASGDSSLNSVSENLAENHVGEIHEWEKV